LFAGHQKEKPRLTMLIAIITILAMECIQAAPLFDFLSPVIIDDNHRIATNHNAHTTIFFTVGKYATDEHYKIIRIPIHHQPMEKGLQLAGEIFHHMKNFVKGKATEVPITQSIRYHKDTLGHVRFNYKIGLQIYHQHNSPSTEKERNVFWIYFLELLAPLLV
jgi:hypothetical protein